MNGQTICVFITEIVRGYLNDNGIRIIQSEFMDELGIESVQIDILSCEVVQEMSVLHKDLMRILKPQEQLKIFVSENFNEALTIKIFNPRDIFNRRIFPSTRGYKITIIILFLIILFLFFS